MTPASTPVPPAAGDVAALRKALEITIHRHIRFKTRADNRHEFVLMSNVGEIVDALLAGPLAEWRATLEASLAAAQEEIAAVDRALEGLAETPRAERVAHWIGVAAAADTRAAEAEASLAAETAAREAAERDRDEAQAERNRINDKLGELNAAVKADLVPLEQSVAETREAHTLLAAAEAEAARMRAERDALRKVIDAARTEAAFAFADEVEDTATERTRRARFGMLRDALNGVGDPAARRALGIPETIEGDTAHPALTGADHAEP